ncbi:hypothetical protein J2X02_003543 [Pseudoxanthomonas japonensis]|nr:MULTISPECIES: hypothetical protein [Pseudoxanthomonas]MBL8258172.1 hypothetical protein [Pseudoxanthomonas mexicana]MDR7070678.1 hypothetical protein [Pseudoxanthomonas japonensis]
MHDRSDRRSRHPLVLLFVGLLLVCDVLVGRFLRQRQADALHLPDLSR